MKMDVYFRDRAKSLDNDAQMQRMKNFYNWNKEWQHPSGGLSRWGDDLLEERLRNKFLGMKLLWNDSLFWIHSVVLKKKREDNKYVLIAINNSFE